MGPIASATASRYACTDLVAGRGRGAVERRQDCHFRSCQRRFRERRLGLGNCDKIPDRQTAPCSGAGSGSSCGGRRSGLSRTADQSAARPSRRQSAWSSSRSLRPDADLPGASFRLGSRLQRGRIRPLRRSPLLVTRAERGSRQRVLPEKRCSRRPYRGGDEPGSALTQDAVIAGKLPVHWPHRAN